MLPLLRVASQRIKLQCILQQQTRISRAIIGASNYKKPWAEANRRLFTSRNRDQQEVAGGALLGNVPTVVPSLEPGFAKVIPQTLKDLPVSCPGCGALSQTVDPDAAGFFRLKRSSGRQQSNPSTQDEDQIFHEAIGRLKSEDHAPSAAAPPPASIQICGRCHQLLHHSTGNSIIHPSMESIRAIIEESPHRQNHIYHIVDAADFPMSLIPNLQHALRLPRLRTQNRRSKTINYVRGRVAEVSFIITRADLLAPKKEQVDRLMPYLQEVLRDALGRQERSIRLGNVRCVSAKRGWWTPVLKEDIWKRGGAGWMVGKVNVGKSALFEVVYPKGRGEQGKKLALQAQREQPALNDVARARDQAWPSELHSEGNYSPNDTHAAKASERLSEALPEHVREPEGYQETELLRKQSDIGSDDEHDVEPFRDTDVDSLLPPLQPETAYPSMPLVSSLPGTTASPIRVPFGSGRGELIDLPGIHRSSLEKHVKPEHKAELVMESRITPEQYSIKPGQSLLLGGMIRITPRTEDLVFLAYPFVPLKPHVTSTDKAVGVQTGTLPDGAPYEGQVTSIANDEARQQMKSAGTFKLEWNVTKKRAGPVTDPAAGKQKVDRLPYIVYGADILIEGVGWVEITCQVRARSRVTISESVIDSFGEGIAQREVPLIPEIEVFSPEGRYVDIRRPMNAWLLGGPQKEDRGRHGSKSRPRMSSSFRKRTQHG